MFRKKNGPKQAGRGKGMVLVFYYELVVLKFHIAFSI